MDSRARTHFTTAVFPFYSPNVPTFSAFFVFEFTASLVIIVSCFACVVSSRDSRLFALSPSVSLFSFCFSASGRFQNSKPPPSLSVLSHHDFLPHIQNRIVALPPSLPPLSVLRTQCFPPPLSFCLLFFPLSPPTPTPVYCCFAFLIYIPQVL